MFKTNLASDFRIFGILNNLKVYNKILKHSIHQAKVQYYNLKINSCKKDSATTVVAAPFF